MTEISSNGMTDFFRDRFTTLDRNSNDPKYTGKLIGAWDNYTKQYFLSIQPNAPVGTIDYYTLAFDEKVLGWPTFYTFKPSFMMSLAGNFFSVAAVDGGASDGNAEANLYQHYKDITGQNRNTFYGTFNKSSIEFILNAQPSISKVFKTIEYEGSNGWEVSYVRSDFTGFDASVSPVNPPWIQTQDTANELTTNVGPAAPQIASWSEGGYIEDGVQYYSGFNRKENKYYANIVNTSTPAEGEIRFGPDMTGIKGYVATVKMTTDDTTFIGGVKEFFSASSVFVRSS